MAKFVKALTLAVPGELHLEEIIEILGVDEATEYDILMCNDEAYIYVNWDTINVAETIDNAGVWDDEQEAIIRTTKVTRIHLNCGSCFYVEGDFIGGNS